MFNTVISQMLPDRAFLARFNNDGVGLIGKTDCFSVNINKKVMLVDYIDAFYTSPLFKIERLILALIGKPSSDRKAEQLAKSEIEHFAAWYVEDRDDNQILLCDFTERTRSWLMVDNIEDSNQTLLYFGSAVVYKQQQTIVKPSIRFSLLSHFHIFYSKALLSAAYKKLMQHQR